MSTADEPVEMTQDESPVPLCLHCLDPVNPLDKVCPSCGGAVGQLTPYLPWEGIRWQTDIWGQMWRQVWQRETPLPGRFVRGVVIAAFVPVMLIGLIPIIWRRFASGRANPSS